MEMLVKAANGQALAFAASYCMVLLLFGVFLAIRVIELRRSKRIGMGDGGERDLARRIRAHGNFSEFAPLLMLTLVLLALLGAKEWLIHLIGFSGVLGRILHGAALTRSAGSSFGRVGGMLLTFASLIIGAISLLVLAWGG